MVYIEDERSLFKKEAKKRISWNYISLVGCYMLEAIGIASTVAGFMADKDNSQYIIPGIAVYIEGKLLSINTKRDILSYKKILEDLDLREEQEKRIIGNKEQVKINIFTRN